MNANRPAYRKWMSRFLVPLAAIVLLTSLFTAGPGSIVMWLFFVSLLVYHGTGMWEDFRRKSE